MGNLTFKKYVPSSLFRGITSSFAGSIQTMIFFSIGTCTIGSQGGPNKIAAANFLWLQFLSNRSSIQSFFFFSRSVEYYNSTMSVLAISTKDMIYDIYPGSSTHSKVVFREVLHPIELE